MQSVQIRGRRGHYSIKLGSVYGTLVRNLEVSSHHVHNPSFNTYSRYNVYTDMTIRVPVFDQHRGANHQNLIDNVDAFYFGRPQVGLLFKGSGTQAFQPRAGAFNTFWNINVEFGRLEDTAPVQVADEDAAPKARIVGLYGNAPLEVEYGPNPYIEGLNRPGIAVPSLYEYQLRRRERNQKPLSVQLIRPLDGYQYEPGDPIFLKAEVLGAGSVERMDFRANGRIVGTDTTGADGWGVVWKGGEKGRHRIDVVAQTSTGANIPSRPMSCDGNHPTIWIGNGDSILKGNAPNPFSHETTIRYTLRKTSRVQVVVYDVLGRQVRTLVDHVQESGEQRVTFGAENLSSGMYVYEVRTGTSRETGKLTIIQ
jgi:hypothetical protein